MQPETFLHKRDEKDIETRITSTAITPDIQALFAKTKELHKKRIYIQYPAYLIPLIYPNILRPTH